MSTLLLLCFILLVLATYLRARRLIKKTLTLEKLQRYERILPNPAKTFLFLGDSTTVGTGCEHAEESVAGRFAQAYPQTSIINRGINGQKIQELLSLYKKEPAQHVDLTVIQIGANDIIRFTPLHKIQQALSSLLTIATKQSDKVVILHSGNVGSAPFFPWYLGWIWTLRTKRVRELYIDEVRKHSAHYVDLFQERKDDPFLKDIHKYYAPDYLHLTGEGYKVWFDKIRQTLNLS